MPAAGNPAVLTPTYPTGLPLHLAPAAVLLGWNLGARVVFVGAALAQPNPAYVAEMNRDQPGAGDHPLTGRYGGSKLLAQTIKAFDEITLPAGPAQGQTYDNNKKFTQTVTAPPKQGQAAWTKTSTGSFVFMRPGRFRFDYQKPFPQTLVADGQTFWLYDPDIGQATARSQAQALGSTPEIGRAHV